uniref:Uncharacterized protein n=1 Tax=Zooxanthella nutricula TaxID=1333877 RepID=A0A7S2LM17_9DINO
MAALAVAAATAIAPTAAATTTAATPTRSFQCPSTCDSAAKAYADAYAAYGQAFNKALPTFSAANTSAHETVDSVCSVFASHPCLFQCAKLSDNIKCSCRCPKLQSAVGDQLAWMMVRPKNRVRAGCAYAGGLNNDRDCIKDKCPGADNLDGRETTTDRNSSQLLQEFTRCNHNQFVTGFGNNAPADGGRGVLLLCLFAAAGALYQDAW